MSTETTPVQSCQHEDWDDYFDRCNDCGEAVQMYTECAECGWFGIPIIDGGAPETCNKCLSAEIERLENGLDDADLTSAEREELVDALEEAEEDLQYFIDRQDVLDESERRFND